ncbi:hypothetical protein SS50377_23820 [Spironucleus salmonicida]|uniref:Uncharacterized protein n=1 Tax=Spironucleus salmonicida TaxID=348837 RepID=V6M048_9EUKA|nr:hypothetical protein SS50377_23820 [Spironucleus salmonicida]|eukprot:EST46499.1 hypothetical protein SS50377_13580 [Spironucleus salmonicida]
MDFSFSNDEVDNNEKEDWEIEAEKAIEAKEEKNTPQQIIEEPELDNEIKARQQQLSRDQHNAKIAQKFMGDVSTDEEAGDIQRDYTLENDFMAGEVKVAKKNVFDVKLDSYESFDRFGTKIGAEFEQFYSKGMEVQYIGMFKKMVEAAFATLQPEHISALGKFCYDTANAQIKSKSGKKATKKPAVKKAQINTYAAKLGDDDEDDFM